LENGKSAMKTEVWIAFIFGVVFLFIILLFALIAFYLPKPANPGVLETFLFVLQVILALAASGVAAVIPGFLNVNLRTRLGTGNDIAIRAGGAIAVFVIIFLVNPKNLALSEVDKRVGFDERLEKCRNYVPVVGSPLPGALQYCQDAKAFEPARWESYHQLARIYYWNLDYELAIENYEQAINLLTGVDYDKISSEVLVKPEFRTDFSLLAYGVSISAVGAANAGKSPEIKAKLYQISLDAITKSKWFVAANQAGNDLNRQLLYTRAVDTMSIWEMNGAVPDADESLQIAIDAWVAYLSLPEIVPTWAEYHLSCLYAEASEKTTGQTASELREKSKDYIRQSLAHLLQSQNDKSVIQDKLMKCRLTKPELCQPPRGPEPKTCSALVRLIAGDQQVASAIAQL
jgi:tetratricopeptide (TPR) repeat protein